MKFRVTQAVGTTKSMVVEIKTDGVSGTVYSENGKADARVNSYYEGFKPATARKELLRLFKLLVDTSPDGIKLGEYDDGK